MNTKKLLILAKPNVPANLLSIGDSIVDQPGIAGLLGGSQDQRGVGGGISGLVLSNGYTGELGR